jgi:chromosome segregation ATPase
MTLKQSADKIPTWQIIGLIFLLIAAALLTLTYYKIAPVCDWVNGFFAWVHGFNLGSLNITDSITGIVNYVTADATRMITLISGLAGISVTIYSLYSKVKADKAAAQAAQAKLEADMAHSDQLSKINSVVTQQQTQLGTYESQITQLKNSTLDTQLNEAQTLVTTQAQQLKSAQSQIQALNDVITNLKVKTQTVTLVK